MRLMIWCALWPRKNGIDIR